MFGENTILCGPDFSKLGRLVTHGLAHLHCEAVRSKLVAGVVEICLHGSNPVGFSQA